MKLGSWLEVTARDEVVTFVSRNLEPYRSYDIFMRALPKFQRRRPDADMFIVSSDGTSYSAKPAWGPWKERFLAEAQHKLDFSRIHFVSNLPYPPFLELVAISRLYVFQTYSFVMSWSQLEAMTLSAPILANDAVPLREVIEHGANGMLFTFFDLARVYLPRQLAWIDGSPPRPLRPALFDDD